MRLKDILEVFHEELDAIYGTNEVNSFFNLLIEYYLNLKRITLVLEPKLSVTSKEKQSLLKALGLLKAEVPIQYIICETEFFGLSYKVNKHTLIPRPETEELVSWILDEVKVQSGFKNINILDIGTGSGCIAIALAKHLQNAKVFALDVSKEALKVAGENAKLNDVEIHCIEENILSSCDSILEAGTGFDIIVSNPPYVRNLEKAEIKNNVLQNEPHLALFVEDENPLQFYKAIAQFATNNLKNEGALYFEINQYLGAEMKVLMNDYDLKKIELKKDMFGKDRMIKGVKS